MKPVVSSALTALEGPRFSPQEALAQAHQLNLNGPGLYAVYGDEKVWLALGLGAPPDGRPLYVGKAQDDLVARDLKQHFASGQTGRSTLRRTLASLLRIELDLTPQPRGTHPLDSTARATLFKLETEGEARLTRWMKENLKLAFWPASSTRLPELTTIESEIIRVLEPPLCLNQWSDGRWRPQIKRARKEMADLVSADAPERPSIPNSPVSHSPRNPLGNRPDSEAISVFLQKRLAILERDFTTAVEGAQWLDSAGLLKDSPNRRGLPLRVLLRAGAIKGQRQEPNGRWYIDHVDE